MIGLRVYDAAKDNDEPGIALEPTFGFPPRHRNEFTNMTATEAMNLLASIPAPRGVHFEKRDVALRLAF